MMMAVMAQDKAHKSRAHDAHSIKDNHGPIIREIGNIWVFAVAITRHEGWLAQADKEFDKRICKAELQI